MKTLVILSFAFWIPLAGWTQRKAVDTRIDQMRYWMQLAIEGKVPYNKESKAPAAQWRSSLVTPWGQLSPDVRLGDKGSTRSENSVTLLPGSSHQLSVGSNLSDYPVTWLFGTDAMNSSSEGAFWQGDNEGAGGDNNGDPAVDADHLGRLFSGRIARNRGQSVAWSDDKGLTWNAVQVASPAYSSDIFDKNHLCVDRSATSPYRGRVYVAWSYFGSGPDDGHVFLSYSSDRGLSWSVPQKISSQLSSVFLHHGVNLRTGPDGEVYAVWSLYDNWPGDESAIAFTRSVDGGVSFEPARRIGVPIRGNRYSLSPKQMRLNAFPSMAVDCSGGLHRGSITVAWSNKGVPGENLGENSDIWCIHSFDRGDTWSQPIQISHNHAPEPHTSFFPWICSDDSTGNLYTVFYDDRNTDSLSCETWVAASFDGGSSWLEFPISDVAFTPMPIPGMAASYFGDYIGISACNNHVYPVWTDNREGVAASWCSPFVVSNPSDTSALLIRSWSFEDSASVHSIFAGDSAWLDLVLFNTGNQPIVIDSIFFAAGEFCAVTTQPWSTIQLQPGDSLFRSHAALVVASASGVNQTTSHLEISTNSPGQVLNHNLFFKVLAPDIRLSEVVLADESLQANGVPDAGEECRVRLGVVNKGNGIFPASTVMLFADPAITLNPNTFNCEELHPDDSVTFTFTMLWPAEADTGWRGKLSVILSNEQFFDTLLQFFRTSVLTENWESGTMTCLPWSNTPDQPWRIDSIEVAEGHYALRSATPPDKGRSMLSVSYFVAKPDSISFLLKTSSERDYDLLTFRIGNTDMYSWSGRTEWRRVSFLVDSGYQTFSWIYSKDLFNGLWSDCAWIDDIQFPALAPAHILLRDTAVCHSDSMVELSAAGGSFNRLRWASDGDGRFEYLPHYQVRYYLGPSDRLKEVVNLTATALGNLNLVTDTLRLFIQQWPLPPVAVAEPDAYCLGQQQTLSLSSPPLPYVQNLWYETDSLNPFLIAFAGTLAAPDSSVTLRVRSSNSCGVSLPTAIEVHVKPAVSISIVGDTILCRGQESRYFAEGNWAEVVWSTGDHGATTLLNEQELASDGHWIKAVGLNLEGCSGSDSLLVLKGDCFTDTFGKLIINYQGDKGSIQASCPGCGLRRGLLSVYNSGGQVVYRHYYHAENEHIVFSMPASSSGVYYLQLLDVSGAVFTCKLLR